MKYKVLSKTYCMRKLCFNIWLVANLFVFGVLALLFMQRGLAPAFRSLLYSAAFSLPAVFILYYLLKLLRWLGGGVWFSWSLLLFGASLACFLAYTLFRLTVQDASELDFVLPLSFVSGYSSVVFFSPALHYLFLTFQYGNHENN